MNLYDIVKRKDRLAEFDPASVTAVDVRGVEGKERCIELASGAFLRIKRAHEIQALRCFPQVPGWALLPTTTTSSIVEVLLDPSPVNQCQPSVIGRASASIATGAARVLLRWPAFAGSDDGFDLVLRNVGKESARVSVGPLFSARENLLAQLRGSGVEVGPGMNPQVLPSDGLDVRYVESMSGEEWARVYAKNPKGAAAVEGLWKKYVVASAHDLEHSRTAHLTLCSPIMSSSTW